MKKILFSGLAILIIAGAQAQQKEGKVVYQRTIQLQIVTIDDRAKRTRYPRTRTDKFEVNFANGQMMWQTNGR